jgi:hypothetical protein
MLWIEDFGICQLEASGEGGEATSCGDLGVGK